MRRFVRIRYYFIGGSLLAGIFFQLNFFVEFRYLPETSIVQWLVEEIDPRLILTETAIVESQGISNDKDYCRNSPSNNKLFIDCKQLKGIAPVALRECEGLRLSTEATVEELLDSTTRNKLLPLQGSIVFHPPIRWLYERMVNATRYGPSFADIMFASVDLESNHLVTASPGFPEYFNANLQPSVATFRNSFVEVKSGRVQTWCGTVFQFNQCGELNETQFVLRSNDSKFEVYDEAVLLGAKLSTGFYHVTVEHLPRLLAIRDFLENKRNNSNTIPILVNGGQAQLLRTYANQMGISKRITFVTPRNGNVIFASTLYVPEPSPCGHLQSALAQTAQSAIRQNVPAPAAAVPRSIVVVRRRNKRYLDNHDALLQTLMTALPNEHWVEFDEAELPRAGLPQWSIFARAKVVIAPHGAGLANLLACSRDTAVVEFMAEQSQFNLCFMSLASVLNMEYHPIRMDFSSTNSRVSYVVDVTEVVQVVVKIVKRRNMLQTYSTE